MVTLVFAVLWSIAAALTKYDDRMFRILSLWLQTKFVMHTTRHLNNGVVQAIPLWITRKKGAEINGGIA
ncbi:VirB3 family type IV secretion system protein [Enterobacter cloacae]|uniref:VirB3 family type IV secretion system protein n=1 Tax=Enterobacter cloacae TaxID=550 RepID=UPI00388E100F